MTKIKSPLPRVYFNMSERDLCSKCGYPERFCKHTIEDKYRVLCPNTPLEKEDVWQLVRSYAILRFEEENRRNYLHNEITRLESINNKLTSENDELTKFKKVIESMLSRRRGV